MYLFLQQLLPNLFELLTWHQKLGFDIHFDVFCSATLPAPPCLQFYCYYRPPKRQKSPTRPWSAVLCGASRHSNQFLVPGRFECGGEAGSQSGPLFLSVVMLPHRSGQISERAALYYTHAKHRKRWLYTLWKQGKNCTDPSSWWTSQTRLNQGKGKKILKFFMM